MLLTARKLENQKKVTDEQTNGWTDERTDELTKWVTWSLLELLIAAKNPWVDYQATKIYSCNTLYTLWFSIYVEANTKYTQYEHLQTPMNFCPKVRWFAWLAFAVLLVVKAMSPFRSSTFVPFCSVTEFKTFEPVFAYPWVTFGYLWVTISIHDYYWCV